MISLLEKSCEFNAVFVLYLLCAPLNCKAIILRYIRAFILKKNRSYNQVFYIF